MNLILLLAVVGFGFAANKDRGESDLDARESLKPSNENVTTIRRGKGLFGLGSLTRVNNRYQNNQLNSPCDTQVNTPGICMRNSECIRSGGVPSGVCWPVGICCLNTVRCGETSNGKQIVIEGTAAGRIDDCFHNIVPFSQLVCQLRVDFSIAFPPPEVYIPGFIAGTIPGLPGSPIIPPGGIPGRPPLLPPGTPVLPPGTPIVPHASPDSSEGKQVTFLGTPLPVCLNAYVKIGNYRFCGNDINQHIYLPFSAVNLANSQILIRQSTTTSATWKITVTQIECPSNALIDPLRRVTTQGWNLGGNSESSSGFGNLGNFGNFGNFFPGGNPIPFGGSGNGIGDFGNFGNFGGSGNFGLFSQVFPSTKSNKGQSDIGLIAPPGCFQYFTAERGVIQSFNQNSGYGPYPPDMRYAICIRRPPFATGLLLNFTKFSLSTNLPQGFNEDCVGRRSAFESNDYLLVPFATNSYLGDNPPTRYCGSSLLLQFLELRGDLPFIIFFNSGSYLYSSGPVELNYQRAFEIHYDVLK